MGGWWGWLEVRRGKQACCGRGRGQRYHRMYACGIGNSGMEVALLGRGWGSSGGLAPWLPLGGCALLTEHSGQGAPGQARGRPLQGSKMRGKRSSALEEDKKEKKKKRVRTFRLSRFRLAAHDAHWSGEGEQPRRGERHFGLPERFKIQGASMTRSAEAAGSLVSTADWGPGPGGERGPRRWQLRYR